MEAMEDAVRSLVRRARYAFALGLVAALAACGGSTSPEGLPPDEFASTFCESVELWRDRLADGSRVLAERLNQTGSLREARGEFLRFFDGAIRETDVMIAQVSELEPPAFDTGEAVVTDLVELLRRFKPILVGARRGITRLPLGNEMEFITGAQSIGAAYQTEVEQLGPSINMVVERNGIPELTLAVQADAACKRL
jgi:hypothetical protein